MILPHILIFILGLVFGSFVAALTWRYPRQISIAKGRSFCPNCKRQIAWYDNIPLLSFLFLGGKCRNCRKKISFRYPLIEFSTGLGFLIIFLNFSSYYFQFIYSLILFLILILILVIDLEGKIIPDLFVFCGIGLAFFYYIFVNGSSLFPNLFTGLAASVLLLIIHLVTKGRGMGLGDVKLAVLGGLIVGPRLFLVWLFLAFLTGAIVGSILILGRKAGFKSQIAFGPFLVLAIPLALIYGEKILFWIHIS